MSETAKNRGRWLSLWLLFLSAIVTIGILGLLGILLFQPSQSGSGAFTPFDLLSMVLLGIFQLIGLDAIWKWKKWGLWLYVISLALLRINNLRIGSLQPLVLLLDLCGVAILGILVRPAWKYFE
jgi:hypothetical protein